MDFDEFWKSEAAAIYRNAINDDAVASGIAIHAFLAGQESAANEARKMIDEAFGNRLAAKRAKHETAQN